MQTLPRVIVCSDKAVIARRAVQCVTDGLAQTNGVFRVALAGGSTPGEAYRLLAQTHDLPKERLRFFSGDERILPLDHKDSNARMVRETLFSTETLKPGSFVPIQTEDFTPEQAARAYEETLSREFGLPVGGLHIPQFDLVFLGVGDDGHTASLFPGKPALHVTQRWVVPTAPGVLPPSVDRVTLTFPVLNAARNVVFLISGASKAQTVRTILEDTPTMDQAPAAHIRPKTGTLTYLLDAEAASQLNPQNLRYIYETG
jgi:6-phosphogluconolactonase